MVVGFLIYYYYNNKFIRYWYIWCIVVEVKNKIHKLKINKILNKRKLNTPKFYGV